MKDQLYREEPAADLDELKAHIKTIYLNVPEDYLQSKVYATQLRRDAEYWMVIDNNRSKI